ncbi:MAG: CHAP domain-containing protein [Aquihabitans sp.]
MNIDQVEELGRFLQGRASALEAIAKEIDGRVRGTSWIGTDANRFQNQWWPEHRNRMTTMAETVKGFGQSALNNASDQRRTSDAGGTVAGPGGKLTPKPATTPGGGAPPRGPPPAGGTGAGGGPAGELPNSHRSWEDAQKAYIANGGVTNNPAYNYQCVAWARARWQELGYSGPIHRGDGWEQAGMYGGTTHTDPTLGAMVSTSKGQNHVMIVEQVTKDSSGHWSIRVSEMNTGHGVDPHSAAARAGVAVPQEYRDDRWITQDAAGNWHSGTTNYGPLTIAGIPR